MKKILIAFLVVFGVVLIGYQYNKSSEPETVQKPNVLVLAHTTGAGAASAALKKIIRYF